MPVSSMSVFHGVHELLAGEDAALLFCGPGTCTRGAFRRRVHALAACLPEAPALINLCERRDAFITAFCAAALRGQATLLPSSRASQAIEAVQQQHPGAACIDDAGVMAALAGPEAVAGALPVAAEKLAMVGFTSGSTGVPSAHGKTWAALRHTDACNQQLLQALCGGGGQVVATVPPQHMYGMELSVLLPLLGPFAVHPGRPFFPQDVAEALAECVAPRVLVTTPVHLRALLESGLELPPLAVIISATAPLSGELAVQAEARFGCELHEVFGATEVCILAHRRSAKTHVWQVYDEVRLLPQEDGTEVQRPSLPQPVLLADHLALSADGRSFQLRGRQADLLEIAGKRASLADLTRRLQGISGVRDAVMLQLDADAAGVRRLLAVVVADAGLSDGAILATLREGCDPVFLPRRIVRVAALPRNETGKLPRQALLALLENAG